MNWISRKKITPIHIVPGDSLELSYEGKILLVHICTVPMTINEVGIFTTEIDGRKALGGVFINE